MNVKIVDYVVIYNTLKLFKKKLNQNGELLPKMGDRDAISFLIKLFPKKFSVHRERMVVQKIVQCFL